MLFVVLPPFARLALDTDDSNLICSSHKLFRGIYATKEGRNLSIVENFIAITILSPG